MFPFVLWSVTIFLLLIYTGDPVTYSDLTLFLIVIFVMCLGISPTSLLLWWPNPFSSFCIVATIFLSVTLTSAFSLILLKISSCVHCWHWPLETATWTIQYIKLSFWKYIYQRRHGWVRGGRTYKIFAQFDVQWMF